MHCRDLLWALAIPFEITSVLSGKVREKAKTRGKKIFVLFFCCSLFVSVVISVSPIIMSTAVSRSRWGICTFSDQSSYILWNAASWVILLCSIVAYLRLWIVGFSNVLTHSLTHYLTHLLTHYLTHLLTHYLTHLLTHSLTHSLLTHSPARSLARSGKVADRCRI